VAFKGLFIGIDRYASTEINWLSCAARDAIALHASGRGRPSLGTSCEKVPHPDLQVNFEELVDRATVICYSR
jgi:hypothetical protein